MPIAAKRRSVVAAARESRPPLGELWNVLATVPDPEIPVVSVIELGILRGIAWDGDEPTTLDVTVTPTYSGCPATELIAASIRDALTAAGVRTVRIATQLAPAWTTDWITADGRRKLRAFGIAPPDGLRAVSAPVAIDVAGISPLRRSTVAVACPLCASLSTRLLSQFGSTACKAHYRCLDCLEPFDYFKPH
jgi:ring-1,2-phenylacetyl-CoA epoxidase subunit PaaD